MAKKMQIPTATDADGHTILLIGGKPFAYRHECWGGCGRTIDQPMTMNGTEVPFDQGGRGCAACGPKRGN